MNKYFNLLLILLFSSSFNAFLSSMTPNEQAIFDALATSEKDEKDRRDRQRKNQEELDSIIALSLQEQNNKINQKIDEKMQRELNNQLAQQIKSIFDIVHCPEDYGNNWFNKYISNDELNKLGKKLIQIKELIYKGANINTEVVCTFYPDKYIVHTILSLITINVFKLKSIKSEEFINFLIQNGANINFITWSDDNSKNGRSCLDYIITSSINFNFIKSFIKSKGLFLNIKDQYECTLLMKIVYEIPYKSNLGKKRINNIDFQNILEIIEYLIQSKQIDINTQNIDGNTVLHYLLKNNLLRSDEFNKLFELLINAGANPNIPNQKGIFVLDELKKHSYNECITIYNNYKQKIGSIITNHTPCYNNVSDIILSYLW